MGLGERVEGVEVGKGEDCKMMSMEIEETHY